MKLGLLSDTHGHRKRTRRALALLDQLGAEAFIHCGDLGGPDILDELLGRQAWWVVGNTDEPARDLLRYSQALGLPTPNDVPLAVELAGKRLLVMHGHELWAERLSSWVRRGDLDAVQDALAGADYLLHGHSHVARDDRIGTTRVINPGALHRVRTQTVATLDLAKDDLIFWRVPDADAATDAPPERVELAEI